jgi:hypothetical protein
MTEFIHSPMSQGKGILKGYISTNKIIIPRANLVILLAIRRMKFSK